jgi:DNA-binding beta-propeller fold protein YncE
MLRRPIIAFFGVVLLFQACTDRPRQNPFDPQNPQAIVRPTGLRIVSEDRDVRLTWQPVERSDLMYYTVYRRAPDEVEFRSIAQVSPPKTEYRETGLEYNREYQYQLSYTTPQGESERSEAVSIIPGPNSKWVLDTGTARLIKLTFDTRHLITRGPSYFRPLAMAVSRRDRTVWVGEGLADFVDKISRDGSLQVRITGIDEPHELAVNQVTGDCWFYDPRARVLGRIDALGRNVVGFTSERFSDEMRLAVNSLTGEAWLADVPGKILFRLSPSGVALSTLELAGSPAALAVSVKDNAVWMWDATTQEVVKMNTAGAVLARAEGFENVMDLAVNEVTGDCWVVERSLTTRSGRVVRLSAAGERLLSLEDFTAPTSVAVDLFDNSIVVSDIGRSSVLRISEDGEVLGEFTELVSPRVVGID